MLPSVVLIDSLLGVPEPLHGVVTLMTLGSALTAFILVERELENDKGQGDQAGGIFVSLAHLCRILLRVVSLVGLAAMLGALGSAVSWIAAHQFMILLVALSLLTSILAVAFWNVRIPIPRFRKEE